MEKIKTCSNCDATSDTTKFKGGQCLSCVNSKQREYRLKTGNAATKAYEKTVSGYIMRTYRNMLSRVTGILKNKAHLYEGKEILDKESFYDWTLNSEDFKNLLEQYVTNDCDPKLAPSIDRIDSAGGYTLGNIRWVTHSENSRLGAISRNSSLQPKEKCIMPVGGPL